MATLGGLVLIALLSIIYLSCLQACTFSVSSNEYINKYCDLTSFPDDIPIGITDVTVSNNDISEITTASGAEFTYLDASSNELTEFPNLNSVATTLETLYLDYNLISYINEDYLLALVVLSELEMFDNKLTALPDLARLPGKLTGYYGFQENLITELPNLGENWQATLDISDNPISVNQENFDGFLDSLQDGDGYWGLDASVISYVPSSICSDRLQDLYVDRAKLSCNCHIRWLKLASLTGKILDLANRPCTQGPEHLTSVNWEDITINDLQCQGKFSWISI